MLLQSNAPCSKASHWYYKIYYMCGNSQELKSCTLSTIPTKSTATYVNHHLFCILIRTDRNWKFDIGIEGHISEYPFDTICNAFIAYGLDELRLSFLNFIMVWHKRMYPNAPCCQCLSQAVHYQLSWWCRQMTIFTALLDLCEGNHRSPVDSPHKGQRGGALMFSLSCARTNCCVNNRDAGDLRRHRAHCDVAVMLLVNIWLIHLNFLFKLSFKKECAVRDVRGLSWKYSLFTYLPAYLPMINLPLDLNLMVSSNWWQLHFPGFVGGFRGFVYISHLSSRSLHGALG